jgi:L-rhamnonate dehydratase
MSIAIDSERAYLSDDVVTHPPQLRDGAFALPRGPGLGMTPDFDKIARYQTTAIADPYLDRSRPGWFATKPAY